MNRHLSRAVEAIDEAYLSDGTERRGASGYLRKKMHRASPGSPWQEYQAAKVAWVACHPGATPAECAAALERIRTEFGRRRLPGENTSAQVAQSLARGDGNAEQQGNTPSVLLRESGGRPA